MAVSKLPAMGRYINRQASPIVSSTNPMAEFGKFLTR